MMTSMLVSSVVGQTRGIAFFFRAGYSHLNVSEEKMSVMCNPVSSFHKSYYGIGGEAYLRADKNVFGWDAMVSTHGPSSSDSSYAEPFIINSSIKYGFILHDNRNLILYPAIGVGAGLIGITTYSQYGHLKKDINTMYVLNPICELSLNADKMVYTFANGRATGAFLFGIRAGYRFSKSSDDWKKVVRVNNSKEKMSLSGYYLTISLGAGNFRRL